MIVFVAIETDDWLSPLLQTVSCKTVVVMTTQDTTVTKVTLQGIRYRWHDDFGTHESQSLLKMGWHPGFILILDQVLTNICKYFVETFTTRKFGVETICDLPNQ